MGLSSKTRVAVVRGGRSHRYDDSLQTGNYVLSALREMPDHYEPLDIFISKDGEWHKEGVVHEPYLTLRHADVVWNALHGVHRDEGRVEKLFENLGVPFTGSKAFSSSISDNRDMSKRLYNDLSFHTPRHQVFTVDDFDDDKLIEMFRSIMHPVIVKPISRSNSFNKKMARTFKELKNSIQELFSTSPKVVIEEYIEGDEFSCLVLEGGRGEKIYAMLPYTSSSSKVSTEESKEIERLAKEAHSALGLRHYSSSNFIVSPSRRIYIMGTESTPAFHEDSSAHNSLVESGWSPKDFVDHVIKLAV